MNPNGLVDAARITFQTSIESLVGRLLLYDALQARVSTVSYGWDPESPLNGRNPRFKDLSHHRQEVVGSKG